MRSCRYPGLAKHAEEHLRFMSDLKDLQEASRLADVSEQLITPIKNWLLEHTMNSDRQFTSWLGVTGERCEEIRVVDVG